MKRIALRLAYRWVDGRDHLGHLMRPPMTHKALVRVIAGLNLIGVLTSCRWLTRGKTGGKTGAVFRHALDQETAAVTGKDMLNKG